MIPTLPLAARNRLAAIILAALHDGAARRQLDALATGQVDGSWMLAGEAEPHALLVDRAARARAAVGALPLAAPEPALPEALAQAAALFDAGLGFEAHERLEPYWARAEGTEREALQGLIQIAVGFQHRANGNLAGFRALVGEGADRLAHGRLPGLDLAGFAAAARGALADPAAPPPRFPRLA